MMAKHRRREDNILHILTDLRNFPDRTAEEHRVALDLESVDTIRSYYTELVDRGLASRREIVLTPEAPKAYQRFWIFIETTFQTKIINLDRELEDYQPKLVRKVREEVLETRWKDKLTLLESDVVLGGAFDIVLLIAAEDHEAVHEFVTEFLRTRPFVLRTSTGWAKSEGRPRSNM